MKDYLIRNKTKIYYALLTIAAIVTIVVGIKAFFWPNPTPVKHIDEPAATEAGRDIIVTGDGNQVINNERGNINNVGGDQHINYGDTTYINEQKPQRIDPDSPSSDYKMGLQYLEELKYPKALEYFEKALAEHKERSGAAHVITAKIYNSLASVYYAMAQYDKAEEYYRHALIAFGDDSEKNSKAYAVFCNNLALVYFQKGDYIKALEMNQKALKIHETALASTYNNIAIVYDHQADYEQALEWYWKALPIVEKVLGKNHPHTKIVHDNITEINRRMGDVGGVSE